MITLALSKGRIFDDILPLLKTAGIAVLDDPDKSRKLILDTNQPDLRVVLVRATDVPTYVQYGGADIGVVGKDTLLESGSQGLYQPLDLQIAKCRISVAVREGFVIRQEPLAKTLVSPNSVVTLFVSKGVPAVELPNLIGQRFSKARETLQDLDFIVRHEEVDSAERKGTVVDQNPKAGKVAPESQVTLFVSKGRQELEFPQEPT